MRCINANYHHHPPAPAKIDKPAKSQKARIGDTVSLKCEISGNPIPSGTWYNGSIQIKDEGRFLVETAEDFSELEIEGVQKTDEGEYTCVVKNDFGQDKCSVKLTVAGKLSVNIADVTYLVFLRFSTLCLNQHF